MRTEGQARQQRARVSGGGAGAARVDGKGGACFEIALPCAAVATL